MAMLIEGTGVAAVALLAEIHAQAFPANQAWDAAALALMLGLPGHFALLARHADQALGFVLGRVQAEEAEMITFAVRSGEQGKGVGKLLLKAALAEAQRRGAIELFLEVAEQNAVARLFYAHAGAKQVGRRRHYYANGDDALILRFDL